jgi:hypothetical protein
MFLKAVVAGPISACGCPGRPGRPHRGSPLIVARCCYPPLIGAKAAVCRLLSACSTPVISLFPGDLEWMNSE